MLKLVNITLVTCKIEKEKTCHTCHLHIAVPEPMRVGMGFMLVWVQVEVESPVGYP